MSELKVTFTDKNNKYQYDGHAHCIRVNNVKSKGKGNGGKNERGQKLSTPTRQEREKPFLQFQGNVRIIVFAKIILRFA